MQYSTTRNGFRIKLLLLAGTLLIIVIVLIDIFSSDSGRIGSLGRNGSRIAKPQQEELIQADELLHARLWQLQHMDQQFASLATSQTGPAEMSKANASIQYAEEAFRNSVDSIQRIGSQYDEEMGTNDFQNMTSFFKKILENRRFLAFTRQSLLSGGNIPGNEKLTILKLQNDLYEKDKIIASYASKDSKADNKEMVTLQNQLGEKDKRIVALETQMQKEQAEKQVYAQTNQKLQSDLAEKEKMIAALGNKKEPGGQKALLQMQNEISAKNKQIGTLQAQLQKEQGEKQQYTQAVQKLQNELSEKNKLISISATKKSPTNQKELVTLQNEVNLRLKQVSTLQAQILKDDAELKASTREIKKLQNELTQKNNQTTAAGNKNSARDQKVLLSLQNDISEKNKKIRNLEIQMRKEETERQAYTQTINNLQTELIEKNKLIASAGNRKVPTDQKALVTLQNEIAEKDKRIRRLEDQLQNSAFNKPADTEAIKELQQRNTSLRLAYNNTMTQLGVLQKKYNLLKTEMDLLKNQPK